jgi:hypothetical protein
VIKYKLASFNRRSENVRILPAIITELKFSSIERHIFAAHFVETADNASLEDRPKALDGLSVNCSDDILAFGVVNDAMRIFAVKTLVATPLIRAKQADFVRDGFADERGESVGSDIRDHARNHISLAADDADDRRFAGTDAAGSPAATAFIPMPVFSQAADERFIDFDNSAEFIDVLHESGSDLVAHEPCGFIGTEAHVAIKLQGAHAFLANEHEVNDAIPVAQRLIGVFEDGSSDNGEPIAIRCACPALPMEGFIGRSVIEIWIAATRATDTFWPATCNKIRATRGLIGEQFFELSRRKLMDWLWLLCSGHWVPHPCDERRMACLETFVKSGIFAQIRTLPAPSELPPF